MLVELGSLGSFRIAASSFQNSPSNLREGWVCSDAIAREMIGGDWVLLGEDGLEHDTIPLYIEEREAFQWCRHIYVDTVTMLLYDIYEVTPKAMKQHSSGES